MSEMENIDLAFEDGITADVPTELWRVVTQSERASGESTQVITVRRYFPTVDAAQAYCTRAENNGRKVLSVSQYVLKAGEE